MKRELIGTIILIGILLIIVGLTGIAGFSITDITTEKSQKGVGSSTSTPRDLSNIFQPFSVSGCTAESGFQGCIINSYNAVEFKAQWDFDDSPFINERNLIFKAEATDGRIGSNKLYLLDGRNYQSFWELRRDSCVFEADSSPAGGSYSCDENIIAQYSPSTTAEYSIKGTGEITECPVFFYSRAVAQSGRIYYAYYSRGFIDEDNDGKCNLGRIVECTENSDCASGKFCNQGICQTKECELGKTKCEGFDLYTCDTYTWDRIGKIPDSCGVECRPGNTKCEDKEYFTCNNYLWQNDGVTINRCGVQCLEGTTKCKDSDYYTCENNRWINQGKVAGECEVECTFGQSKCEGFNLYECQDNEYRDQGKIVGQCGIDCLSKQDCFATTKLESSEICQNDNVVKQEEKPICTEEYTCETTEEVTEVIEECEHRCSDGECKEPLIDFKGKSINWVVGIVGFLLLGAGAYWTTKSGGKK